MISDDHYVFADDDGANFVHATHADAVRAQALEIEQTERDQSNKIAAGTSLRDPFHFTDYLRRRHDDPAYTLATHLASHGQALENSQASV